MVQELRNLGHDVDVLTTNWHISKVGPFLFSFRHILRRFQDYDIIHSNEGVGLFVHHPALIETYHHDYAQVPEFGQSFFSALENMECQKARHIIVPSYASKQSLLDYGFSPNKISVIYHGVDNQIFKRDKLARNRLRSKLGLSNKFVVLNVGRFVKHKGQIGAIKAINGLSNMVLILVGKGGEESNIYAAVHKAGVKMLHFADVSDDFLVELYNAADVYLHTSTLEGFGLTVLEAMACGLPIVGYRTADLEQIVADAGCLFPIGDLQSVRSGLLGLEEKKVRNEMKRVALLRSENFSWSESAKKHSQVYSNILNLT